MDNFDLKKYLTEGKLHENEFGGMGLIVKGETSKDNDLIDQAVEESGFYGVYNSRENYWFFPEEGDSASMDTLENELENIFIKKGANVSYEAQFNENLKLEEDKGSMYQLIKLKDIENPYNLHRDLISSLNRFTRATIAKEQGYQGVGLDNELKLTRLDVNNQSSFHKLDKEEVKDTLKRALELYRSTLNERKLK